MKGQTMVADLQCEQYMKHMQVQASDFMFWVGSQTLVAILERQGQALSRPTSRDQHPKKSPTHNICKCGVDLQYIEEQFKAAYLVRDSDTESAVVRTAVCLEELLQVVYQQRQGGLPGGALLAPSQGPKCEHHASKCPAGEEGLGGLQKHDLLSQQPAQASPDQQLGVCMKKPVSCSSFALKPNTNFAIRDIPE
ncbi:MAG: hypothetical protein FRX49_12127 [Trebouxia sp. A1-2]|nr:MAG: hypothetical protein FRX49_12127 [Trebouxia sp. A1-2]